VPHIFVLILLYICPQTTVCVSSCYYMYVYIHTHTHTHTHIGSFIGSMGGVPHTAVAGALLQVRCLVAGLYISRRIKAL
jgi:hypothetical protein